MRIHSVVLASILAAILCCDSAANAGGCKTCPNGFCPLPVPIEKPLAPPSLKSPPKAVTPTCAPYASAAAVRPRRAAVRVVGHLLPPRGIFRHRCPRN
jgi:hypothetical protein